MANIITLNKKNFLIPIVSDKFVDLNDVRKTVSQLQQCISDIVKSMQVTKAAGANTQVQFNDNGAFAGDTGFTYNKTTGTLTALSSVVINGNRPLVFTTFDDSSMYGNVWIKAGGTTEADVVFGINRGSPGTAGYGRMFTFNPPAATSIDKSSGAILNLSGKYWNGSLSQVAIELETVFNNKYDNDFDAELWIEWAGPNVPGGGTGGVFRFAHTDSITGRFKTHDQSGSAIGFWANQGTGANNYVQMATLDGTGFNILSGVATLDHLHTTVGPSYMAGYLYMSDGAVIINNGQFHNGTLTAGHGGGYKSLIGIDPSDVVQVGSGAYSYVSLGQDGTDANPILLRIGGVNQKQVLMGALDSGGVGYRMVRVPN